MTLVVHWSGYAGGVCDANISTQNLCTVLAITSQPLWRASAVITQSRPEDLLILISWIAFCVSSRVGGSIQMVGPDQQVQGARRSDGNHPG